MKKQLLTLALGFLGLSAFSQSTVWQPYNSNIDNATNVFNISAVDTNNVWGIASLLGTNPASNKFTRTTDGANYHAGKFNPDTNTYSGSNISAVDANMAYVCTFVKAADGTAGQLLKTTDGGATWNNVASSAMFNGANNFPDWVHFYDANNGITLGDPNGNTSGGTSTTDMYEIWRTHDGGGTWTRVPDANIPVPGANPPASAVDPEYGLVSSYTTYKHFIWFGSTYGNVYSSADSGKTWILANTAPTGLDGGANGLAFRDSIHGLVWGGDGTGNSLLLATADGGATWTPLTVDATVGTNAISIIPKTKGFMSVGVDGSGAGYVTSVTYDDGATWTVLEAGTADNLRMLSVQMLDSTNGWAGSVSDNTPPHGLGGMNRFQLGHKTGCPLTLTSVSSIAAFSACADSMVTITASGLDTYTWSANAGSATTASVTVTPSVTTTYSVAGTTTAGCTNFDSFDITVPTATISPVGAASHSVCPGINTTLKVAGGSSYTWAPPTGLSVTTGSNVVSTTTTSVTYTITGVKNGCPATTPALIVMNVKPVPSVSVTSTSFSVCAGNGDTLTAMGGTSYTWSPNAGSATTASVVVVPTATNTTYTVTVLSNTVSNCAVKATITVTATTTGICTGIENYTNANNVSVYPNPSTGLVTLSLNMVNAGTEMYVTNMIGQQVVKATIRDLNTNFDFSSLEKGVYFITVSNGTNKHIEKLIIQ